MDKFIGDAVMAIWGAPSPIEDHPFAAVQAALTTVDKIAAAGQAAEARGESSFGIKIGIHSGPAIVGNVGSAQRYNYTTVGETVNIAARLEGLPGVYGCSLLVGPTTAAAVESLICLREIDHVAVKGRTEPLTIFELIALLAYATEAQQDEVDRYHQALELYRDRHFERTAEIWLGLGSTDGPTRFMADRAKLYATEPPPEGWDGVFVMAGK